jgi:hypothetical protein
MTVYIYSILPESHAERVDAEFHSCPSRLVLECHPEIEQIRQLNPGLAVITDLPSIEYVRLEDSMGPTPAF